MFIQSITLQNLSIPDVPFPALLSTLIRRRLQIKPAALLIPIDLFRFLLVEGFYGTRYQSGSFLAKPQSWGAAPRFDVFPPKFTPGRAGPPIAPPAPKTCKAP